MAEMATQARRIRADEVPHIPIDDPASTGYELVDGELVTIMGAKPTHAWLMAQISAELSNFVRDRASGGAVFADVWCLFRLPNDPDRLRAPDVAYFSGEKLARLGKGDFFREVPDLAVEIYSATNYRKRGDFQQRVRDYVEARVPLLWVIYPDAGYAMVHRPDGSASMVRDAESLDGEDVLPGFRLDLRGLFESMP